MSRRRTILSLALGLGSLILAGLGLRDWAIETGWATACAGRSFEPYGIALAARGPAHLSLLPLPRLTLDRVRLTAPGPEGAVLAEGRRLAIDLDILGLLAGRAAASGVALDGARLSRDAAAWAGPFARLSERMRAGVGERPRRISLSRARLADGPDTGRDDAEDSDTEDSDVRDIALEFAWPPWSASADLRAAVSWRGVPTRIALTNLRPADLAAGRRSPFAVDASWAGGSLSADGAAGLPEDGSPMPTLAGRARFETRSLPETLAWLGRDAPLAPLAGTFTLEGRFETAGRSASWPSLRIGLGGNALEGAGAVTLGVGDAARASIQATLAAESLNFAPIVGALLRLFEPVPIPLALAPLTRADLDLRLSAASGRIGPLQVADLAASVLVREASVEVALNRARVQEGTLKGRLTLASGADPADTEAKVQGSFDRLDLGGLLGEIGEAAWMKGPVQGQVSLESSARDSTGLLAHVGGRAALSVEGGVIAGLDLADVIHRNGVVAPGALARRNGRTSFERATATLRFSGGVGEITDATLRGPGIGAALRGQVFLPEQRVAVQADIALRPPADPARGILFEISGPWDALRAQALSRDEAPNPVARTGEAAHQGPLGLPAALGLPGNARAYAP